MGTMIHHAIVVTSWKAEALAEAHEKAVELGAQVSPITRTKTNGYTSFCVFPDGSKEGWEESNVGDAVREGLISWMDRQRYDDGSSALSWAEVAFGEIGPTENGAKITRSTWAVRERGDPEP